MKLVIVESPAKAKTIHKYLGNSYQVVASYGHVRDLPSKNGSVDPDKDFAMYWEVDKANEPKVKAIVKSAKEADEIILATDPDREGEAIAWHIIQILEERNALRHTPKIYRSVFYEITKKAVVEAISNPRRLNSDLIDAYLARRALDYLVGFNISPVLWRKVPGSRSAGRVQSVALRLIINREMEIERFISKEYWDIKALFKENTSSFQARLIQYAGEKLEKLSIQNQQQAQSFCETLEKARYKVGSIEKKQVKRNPQPPFTTSTLQQEASRKLGLSASQTMQIAQKLYEGVEYKGEVIGLITYMRTDSIQMSQDALGSCRSFIQKSYGKSYLPDKVRVFTKKVKNSQEAHEAIRPTSFERHPSDLKDILDARSLKLYELIWKRAVASQMAQALLNQVRVDVVDTDLLHVFRATGSTIHFKGFMELYLEDKDEEDIKSEDKEALLPELQENALLKLLELDPEQHFTQPPPRYTEASLVKKLEELGIGRPSTYASIIQVLANRHYVALVKKQFVPEDKGFLVTVFLEKYFQQYVEYTFTADLEEKLDGVSNGDIDWKILLKKFWDTFYEHVEQAKNIKLSEVIEELDYALSAHFFPPQEDKTPEELRKCPKCASGRLQLKLGKYGAFIGCSEYPECTYIRQMPPPEGEKSALQQDHQDSGDYPKVLGDLSSTAKISLRKGPYGIYLQKDEDPPAKKPHRVSLPKGIDPDSLTLDQAKYLVALPFSLGKTVETQEDVILGIGRYGPYVKIGSTFCSINTKDIFTMTCEHAIQLIEEKKLKPKKSPRTFNKRSKMK